MAFAIPAPSGLPVTVSGPVPATPPGAGGTETMATTAAVPGPINFAPCLQTLIDLSLGGKVSPGGTAGQGAVSIAARKPEKPEKKETPAATDAIAKLASLAAGLAPFVQLFPQVPKAEPALPGRAGEPPAADAAVSSPMASIPVASVPPGAVPMESAPVPTAPAQVESPSPETPVAQQGAVVSHLPERASPGAAPAVIAIARATATKEASPVTGASSVTEASPTVPVVEGATPERPVRTGGGAGPEHSPPAPAANPPSGASQKSPPISGVVRFDGNAGKDRNAGNEPNPQQDKPAAGAPLLGVSHLAGSADLTQPRGGATDVAKPAQNTTPASQPAVPPQVEQVARTVIDQITRGGGEARVHLHPAELGEVLIRVRTDGDRVQVDVHAARMDAQQLLRDHTQDLSNLLGNRGLNLSDVNIGFGGHGAGSAGDNTRGFAGNTGQARAGDFGALMGEEEPAPAGLHNRLQSAYNPDGALSYRI